MEENEQTRFQFEVWFEYTRQIMTELREGTLLAVKNFATNRSETHYTILEIVSIMPIHYALGEKTEGYPGFVMEAARNIATDWTTQEDHSQEDTTIIRCVVAPTGLEIIESSHGRDLNSEQALPMLGSDTRVLTHEATQEIINREISPERDHVFEGGRWLVDTTLPIYVRAEDFVRLHFGIFGFTGAGKSNLVSTYVANLLQTAQTRQRPIKIVLFDLMGEYTVLLLDQLVTLSQANILGIGEHTFPKRVVEFLCGNNSERQNALSDLLNTSLYPKPLEGIRDKFRPAFESLLDENKIKIYQEPTRTFGDFLQENEWILTSGQLGGSKNIINTFVENMRRNLGSQPVSPQSIQIVITAVDQLIRGISAQQRTRSLEGYSSGENAPVSNTQIQNLLSNIQIPERGLTQTAIDNLKKFRDALEREAVRTRKSYPPNAALSLDAILSDLNNLIHSSLLIVQSHDPDELRMFASTLGQELFETRRVRGITSPLVIFIFDEADEFIPQQYERESSYARSAGIAEMLARRGRKFGIGVGICTQRVTYLKTSVLAQPHTYLVSKMPRLSDRQRIQEAFGISEEMFRQTFKFAPGDWLLVSYDATGLKAVPIPIHAEDANERIRRFLETCQRSQRGHSV
jgi:hypothetical protein